MNKRFSYLSVLVSCALLSPIIFANVNLQYEQLGEVVRRTQLLEDEVAKLKAEKQPKAKKSEGKSKGDIASVPLTIHTHVEDSLQDFLGEQIMFEPSAIMAGDKVVTFIAGIPVITSPYLGERPAFDGSDLIVNISSINQDVRLMMRRDAMYRAFRGLGYPEPNAPILALSGAIEPQFFATKSYSGNHLWDIDLGGAELDTAISMNAWVDGYLSFSFDPSESSTNVQRVSNSRVYLSKGFVNVGNNDRTPFYMTAGQIYVPFGRYSSAMVNNPLTLMLARTLQRVVIAGFMHQNSSGFYSSVYMFHSDTRLNGRTAGGFNLGYDFQNKYAIGDVGLSITNSIGESAGMQLTANGTGQFAGFGSANNTELVKKIPAVDVHGSINVDAVSLTAEWVGATQRFRTADLSFNGRGAKPQAIHAEASYTFKLYSKPTSLTAAYGWTKDALAVGLSKQRYSAVLNISLWRDTVQSLEFRHDIDYAAGNQGSGAGATTPVNGSGRHSNTLTGQFALYF